MERHHIEFVDRHYEALIQRVTSVMPITDKLYDNGKLTWTQNSKITNATKMTQSTELLKAVKSGGPAVKSAFYKILQEIKPDVIQELEGSSLQTADDKRVTECYHHKVPTENVQDKMDRPDDDVIRCNPSSIKHRHKIEELKKDPSKKQLCEYDIEDYMDDLRQQEQKDIDNALMKIVKETLLGLQVLHHADVVHRDIKPRNVLIDSGKNARLADFGLSRKLEEGRSTVHTFRAGTRGWEATEILNQSEKSGYKKSSDIQVAGMLVYYILSDGKHPFGDIDREVNIKNGNYSLEHVQDIVAKDLIEWMINKEPAERLTVDEVLRHPFFWDDYRKDAVLRKLGDRAEIQNYETLAKLHNLYIEKEHTEESDPTATLTIDEAFSELNIKIEKKRRDILAIVGEDLKNLWKLFKTAKEATEGKTFSNWKSQLSEIWKDTNKRLPEDILGLLRVLRNKLVHGNVRNEFEENNIFGLFPDFFITLYRVAKDLDWDY
ncbi:uncharacterized protein LOC143722306 isoform X4 [Siphateles boraxobius]|uniref:uncharacterized protein LOC143722306 isoform X4 n=1 Tax=Siphateles boraxobius TaxID=180520 RepID=UPI004063E8C5